MAPEKKLPAIKSNLTEQRLVVRDLTLSCHIGLTDEERLRPQRLRVSLELSLNPVAVNDDQIDETVNYGTLVKKVRDVCLKNNVRLLETLATQISEACFFDERIKTVAMRIEKLDRYPDVAGVGIEITRTRS
ncbi:dihydroneopterin aldolase [Kiloniella laminariae]|uniref:dihydroneopterin aldolase n=1 Tax=Kiloniella laminariae TaxID=454162 RepID=UPI00035DA0F5|nr:dihydroneopterin aldolase [Kiloniella laminariae]